MDVINRDGEILFLRRVKEGPSAESYGLHVARLAGLSGTVLGRAELIMEHLRGQEWQLMGLPPGPPPPEEPKAGALFLGFCQEMAALDLNKITPLDALNLISKWKQVLAPESCPSPAPKTRRPSGEDLPSLFD
jgi:DNA mismatch repair protein MutS